MDVISMSKLLWSVHGFDPHECGFEVLEQRSNARNLWGKPSLQC